MGLGGRLRPKPILVGAEPTLAASKTHRAGIMLHRIIGLTFPSETLVGIPPNIVASMGVGSSSTGYIHLPPLHLNELIMFLNYAGRRKHLSWSIREGRVQVEYRNGENVSMRFDVLPGRSVSLGQILGFQNLHMGTVASRIPDVFRARIVPGFYANPPSLIANSTEEAMMSRCLLGKVTTFTITQMDSLFAETVSMNTGIYTPELITRTIQQKMSDTIIRVEHINDKGKPHMGWIRYSFHSTENFPFTLDFSSPAAVDISRLLGFRQRRYTGQIEYFGKSYPISATKNLIPAPIPSPLNETSRGPLLEAVEDKYRYARGVYTITGTTPSTQRFSLFTEPPQNWSVPNSGSAKNYFESVSGKGIIDIHTRNMASPQSYGFRRGDVVRLTGINQESVPLISIVSTAIKSTQIAGQDVLEGVKSIIAIGMGGDGYVTPPTVTILATPNNGADAPSIKAHILDGKVVAYSVEEAAGQEETATYPSVPILSVSEPVSYTVAASPPPAYAALHNPERHQLTLTLDKAPPAAVVAGRSAMFSGSGSNGALDRAFRVASVSGNTVVLEEDNVENNSLNAANAAGATLRFGVSDAVRATTVTQVSVALAATLPEATAARGMRMSGICYVEPAMLGNISSIVSDGSSYVATHNGVISQETNRVIISGAGEAFDGVWIVTHTSGSQFAFSPAGSPANFSGSAAVVSQNNVSVGKLSTIMISAAAQRPTTAFVPVSVPHPDFVGIGGIICYAPTQNQAHAAPFMLHNGIDSVAPSVPGFLHSAPSSTSLSSSGNPVVAVSGGATVTDVFNTRATATATSSVTNGEIYSSTDSTIVVGDVERNVLCGRFVAGKLRLTLNAAVNSESVSTDNALTLSQFYFDGSYDTWELVDDAECVVPGRPEILLTSSSFQPLVVPFGTTTLSIDANSAPTLIPSTMAVTWGGQYKSIENLNASVGVSNDITTRIGICTYAGYQRNFFRYIFEYNHRNVNGSRGFHDTISSGNIVLTFSRIFAPRTEYFANTGNDMARIMNEGEHISKYTEQIIARRLGITSDLFGYSEYVAPAQWYLDGQPYRLLQFLDPNGDEMGETSHTHVMGSEVETTVFGKLIIPSAYNTIRFQAYEMALHNPRNLRYVRIRLLDYNQNPYPLHGRELTFSVLLVTNPKSE